MILFFLGDNAYLSHPVDSTIVVGTIMRVGRLVRNKAPLEEAGGGTSGLEVS